MTALLDRSVACALDHLARTLPRGSDVITFDAALAAGPAWRRHRVTVLFPPRTPSAALAAVACALSGVGPGAVVCVPAGVAPADLEQLARQYAARLVRVG